MAVSPKSVDMELVRKLVPLDTLALPKIEEILDKSVLQKVPAGRVIFKQGDNDKWTVYLLSGEIELSSSDNSREIIKIGSNHALKPLSKGTPRTQTATANSDVTVLIIDRHLIKEFIKTICSKLISVGCKNFCIFTVQIYLSQFSL